MASWHHVSLACLLGASIIVPVCAQTTDNAAPSGDGSGKVEDIIVTAQRRSERLQKVPLSVVAVTSSVLSRQGILDTTALAQTVPGLDFSRELNGGTPFLRGVGNSTGAVGAEPSVATYVDGVYFPSAEGTIFSLNNIERVEVLKGPQGTLFGRNASGGVIQVITRDPKAAPALSASIGYGNYRTVEASAYATTGIASNLAADIAFYINHQDKGWGHDLTTDKDVYTSSDLGLRSKVLWTPADGTEIRLTADYARSRGDIGAALAPVPGTVAFDGMTRNAGFYNTLTDSPVGSTVRQYGFSGRLDQDVGDLRFVSITSYRKLRGLLHVDTDLTPLNVVQAPITQTQRTISQEFQLQSSAGAHIQWIVGAFLYDDNAAYDPLRIEGAAAAPFSFVSQFARQKTRSYAGFGQVTVPVMDNTRLTAGLRYTTDRRRLSAMTDLGGLASIPASGKSTFNKLTWRLAIDHDFALGILGYASYNRGFKSGSYNLNQPNDPPVRPEVVDAYEVGLKTQLFDNRLRFNLSAFYYDYKDIQLSRTVALANIILNAARAHIKGIDADFDAAFTDRLSLRGGIAYLDGHYKDFPDAPRLLPNVDPISGQPIGGNFSSPIPNAAGNRTIRSPKLTLNLGPNYHVDTDVGPFDLSVLYYYNGGFFWTADNRLKQPSYQNVNATLGWQTPSKRFGAKLWVKNLLNEKYYSYATEIPFGDGYSAAPPRTYGFTLTTKFD